MSSVLEAATRPPRARPELGRVTSVSAGHPTVSPSSPDLQPCPSIVPVPGGRWPVTAPRRQSYLTLSRVTESVCDQVINALEGCRLIGRDQASECGGARAAPGPWGGACDVTSGAPGNTRGRARSD
ncbi:unnamed protein product [Danaus chrysippus]|uniref:(African queen) hypothetical protein n=1 Tax=Danaus chrysippus TaxID=151541 RepID=A0A8J2R519_9NEOP|nr:unnamed protein product [Danaus chrysippus]